jgi:outer membrane lipoprotein-sorting protein
MILTRWHVPAAVAVLAFALQSGFLHGEETTEQIIAELKAKAENVETVRADLKMTTTVMAQQLTMEGSAIFSKPDRTHIEMSMDIGAMKMDQTVISDGTTVWTYQPTLRMVHKIDTAQVAAETGIEHSAQQGGDVMRPFQSLQAESIKWLRSDESEGVEIHVFEGTPAVPDLPQIPFTPAKIELWVGVEDGLLRKATMYDAEGNEVISQSYDNIEVNVDVPEEKFQFVPPEGIQVLDMTENVISMLKGTMEEEK